MWRQSPDRVKDGAEGVRYVGATMVFWAGYMHSKAEMTAMGRKLSGSVLGTVIFLAATGPSAADWLQPRSIADCNIHSPAYPFQSRLEALRQQADQCSEANKQAQWIVACEHMGPKVCRPAYEQTCTLRDEMEQLRGQCMKIYESWRMTKAVEKKRREAQERAEREAGSAVTFGRQVPQGVSSGVRAALGVTGGAWPLSEALTRGGTSGVNGIQKRALDQLLTEMGGVAVDKPGGRAYSAAYPRRSQSQLDHALGPRDGAARHVEAMDKKLPLGEHSVVAGAYANVVTQLVEAQAQGHIDTPLAAIGIAVATWVAWEAGQAEVQMKEEQRKRLQAAVGALLPQQKKVARETLAALEPAPPDPIPEPDPIPDDLGRGGEDLDASYCVSVIRDGNFADLTNNCPFAAFYRCNDNDDPGRDRLDVGEASTVYGCPYLSWGFRKRSFFEMPSSGSTGAPEPGNPPCTLRHQGREISAYECSGIQ